MKFFKFQKRATKEKWNTRGSGVNHTEKKDVKGTPTPKFINYTRTNLYAPAITNKLKNKRMKLLALKIN